MSKELTIHHGLEESAVQEFNQQNVLAIDGLVHPTLARAVVHESARLGLFDKARPLLSALGQVSTLHSGAGKDTALSLILHRVGKAGQGLGLDMYPRANSRPGAQSIELSPASKSYYCHLGGQGVAAFVALEGRFTLGTDEAEGLLEPGTMAFLRDQQTPYRLNAVSQSESSYSTGLFVSGSEPRRDLRAA